MRGLTNSPSSSADWELQTSANRRAFARIVLAFMGFIVTKVNYIKINSLCLNENDRHSLRRNG
jgi:hypothetical protein